MATGQLPFRGRKLGGHLQSDPRSRSAAGDSVQSARCPPKLEDIINKALEKDRNLRYQHAAEMRADLQRLKRDTETGRVASCEFGKRGVAQDSGLITARGTAAARRPELTVAAQSAASVSSTALDRAADGGCPYVAGCGSAVVLLRRNRGRSLLPLAPEPSR